MYLSVTRVQPVQDYQLELTFENNEVRLFDVKPYLTTGVFQKLRDMSLFKAVRVSFDTIEWPGGVDLDPEVLYSESSPLSTGSEE